MNETAYILNTASARSLVIMDEVGRGTGTNDGLSIAWAVSEELLEHIRCRTLFATHYHELAMIRHPHLANRSMEVIDDGNEIIFLRKLKEGASSESYGLHVARLAGLPQQVIERAAEIMVHLQEKEASRSEMSLPQSRPRPGLGPTEDRSGDAILKEIRALNPDAMTPLEALMKIQAWVYEAKGMSRLKERPEKAKPRPALAETTAPGLFD
jgi:DNA mismatch repair protein MutS